MKMGRVIIYGDVSAKIAKLKPNMTEIDLTSIRDTWLQKKSIFFMKGDTW